MSVSLIDGHIDDDVLTDEQIIKAFEDKVSLIASMTSVYLDEEDGLNLYEVMTSILDLINRQKANAEGLTNAVKYLNEQVSSAKAEAVKEFAERLKEYREIVGYDRDFDADIYGSHIRIDIDEFNNLVKEMVGEASG